MVQRSNRAKDNTRKWLDGIIKTLEKNLKTYENELVEYSGTKFVQGILRNVLTTNKALHYYRELKLEYETEGLI